MEGVPRSVKCPFEIKVKRGKIPCESSFTGLDAIQRLQQHATQRHGKRAYHCIHCFATFSSNISLRTHTKTKLCKQTMSNATTARLCCPGCPVTFSSKKGLAAHIKKYHSEINSIKVTQARDKKVSSSTDGCLLETVGSFSFYRCKHCRTLIACRWLCLSHVLHCVHRPITEED